MSDEDYKSFTLSSRASVCTSNNPKRINNVWGVSNEVMAGRSSALQLSLVPNLMELIMPFKLQWSSRFTQSVKQHLDGVIAVSKGITNTVHLRP